ncbi:MAG: lipid-binding SYLF domain-containing protein [Betaproteobacteria bacterium]
MTARFLLPRPQTRRLCALLAIGVAATLAAPAALAQSDQRRLVTAATVTLASFLSDPNMTWLQQNIGRARAVMIAPEVTKASIIVGGAGGRAVVVVRDPKSGRWAGPAFYTLATASIGLQAGVTVSEVVTLMMTESVVAKLLSNSFRMGGDVAIAVGPVGGGAQSNFLADLVSFSRAQGVYLGANLDGTVVSTTDDWNQLYYGRRVQVTDILVRKNVHSDHAKELLNVIAIAARKSTEARGGK